MDPSSKGLALHELIAAAKKDASILVVEENNRATAASLRPGSKMSRGRERLRRDFLYDDPIDCGVCTLSKHRKAPDETRTVSQVHRGPSLIAAYGLFAGHGGATASELCARNFLPTLLDDSALHKDPERAIRNSCQAIEAFVLAKSSLDRAYYGTTLLFVLLKGQHLYIANIGNSRAVLATIDGIQTITQEHDGSHAEEVARVRNAGGFFQDGKVNNLVRVTRSIGDLELKDRKHVTFPNLEMTEDIVIPIPDIFCRTISERDEFFVLATAEVWDTLTNKAVVQIVYDALRRGDNSRNCAKKVASAAIASGARGPLTVMLLLFPRTAPNAATGKATVPPPRRTSRPSNLKRHSPNAEQEIRSRKNKSKPPAPALPPFVLQAQAQARVKIQAPTQTNELTANGIPRSSPVTSPHASGSKEFRHRGLDQVRTLSSADFLQAPVLSVDAPPKTLGNDFQFGLLTSSVQQGSKAEAKWGLAEEQLDSFECDANDLPSRRQIDRERIHSVAGVSLRRVSRGHRELAIETRPKAAVVSHISELTASGATGGRKSRQASYLDRVPDENCQELIDYNPSGPSKVRYKEDGSVQGGRFSFFKGFGKTFVKRR